MSITSTSTDQPIVVSDNLKAFFGEEFANEETMRRDSGDYDASFDPDDEVYVPPSSLGTALDSWRQAPSDVLEAWLGLPGTMPQAERTARVEQAEADLHALIAEHGEKAPLSDLI